MHPGSYRKRWTDEDFILRLSYEADDQRFFPVEQRETGRKICRRGEI